MRPSDFLRSLTHGEPEPVYLFLGAEAYQRSRCRKALQEVVLPQPGDDSGLTRHDLEEAPLREVVDDARSLSLFARKRLIWARSAEAAVPRGRSSAKKDDPGATALADYVNNPTPDVVLVLEASRYELAGEGKRKLERVRKYFGTIPPRGCVEFAPYEPDEAQRLARELAREVDLKMGMAEAGLLAEAVGYDGARIATEIEKLHLYAGEEGHVTARLITEIVPSARVATIFELVAALGQGNRRGALELLDTLIQEGEYLPLALSFLATQCRQALVVKEMQLRTPAQIQSHFQKAGIRIWPKKAREIQQTAKAFTSTQIKTVIEKIHEADRSLRDARPDDRTVMEEFVLSVKR